MHILLLIYSLVVVAAYLWPHTYYSELFLSFVPYHGFILFVGVLISCYSYRKTKYKLIWIGSILFGITVATYTNLQWIMFYHNEDLQTQPEYVSTDEDIGLTYFFANILKTNENYEGIKQTIKELDPDVVLLSEYKEEHHKNFKDFFGKEYKYINRIIGQQDVVGNVIFSKYPMEDFAPKVYQEARRYGYVAVKFGEKNYYFYHIHTSAPVSEKHRRNRQEQLDKFTNSFIEQDQQRLSDDRVVIVGDFNVTPRSPDFKKFDDQINLTMTHYSQFTPMLTTWGYGSHNGDHYPLVQSLIRAHIDHMWYNKNTTIYDIQIVPIPGSDHDGIFARIE